MPAYPIVDTHVHFWAPGRLRYPWLDDEPELNRPFLPGDYRAAVPPVNVEALVFVQADTLPEQGLDEVAWVESLAARTPIIQGMVAFAPLEQGADVQPILEELHGRPLVRGVRRLLQSEPDPEFCLRAGFVEGVRLLARYDLSFDICIFHHQLPGVLELVRRCPDVRFVLDHIGKPAIRDAILDPWREHIRTLAAMPNVYCKLSGLVTEADHARWTAADLQPYIEHVIECFGFDRVMFGSDWPVQVLATDYPRWVETLEQAVAGASENEKRRLFVENGRRFYRLDR